MRRPLLLLILLILIVAGAAAAFVLLSESDTGSSGGTEGTITAQATAVPATEVPTVNVIVAFNNIRRGERFPSSVEQMDQFARLVPYPADLVPAGALTEQDVIGDQEGLELLINKLARIDLVPFQPIAIEHIVDDPALLVGVGSDAALAVPSGNVAISIPMDRLTGVAGGLDDGDSVDIILSMLFVNVDEEFQAITPNTLTLITIEPETGALIFSEGLEGRLESVPTGPIVVGPQERQRPRLVTQTTIQDALVVHVGTFLPGGRLFGTDEEEAPPVEAAPVDEQADGQQAADATALPPTPIPFPDIVTLAVSPQDAVTITWAVEARLPMTLVLRSASDAGRGPGLQTNSVSLETIRTTFGIEPPPVLDFTIEPSITSIRRILIGNEASLSPQEAGQ